MKTFKHDPHSTKTWIILVNNCNAKWKQWRREVARARSRHINSRRPLREPARSWDLPRIHRIRNSSRVKLHKEGVNMFLRIRSSNLYQYIFSFKSSKTIFELCSSFLWLGKTKHALLIVRLTDLWRFYITTIYEIVVGLYWSGTYYRHFFQRFWLQNLYFLKEFDEICTERRRTLDTHFCQFSWKSDDRFLFTCDSWT